MIRERNQTFKLAFIGVDLVLSALAAASAFILHFEIVSPEKKLEVIPHADSILSPGVLFPEEYAAAAAYLFLGAVITFMQVIVFIATDLYHPRRGLNFTREMLAITRGVMINLMLVLVLVFFLRVTSFSRLVVVYIACFSILYHSVGHFVFRKILEQMRARGYNIRRVLILGTGPSAQSFARTLLRHSIYGYRVVGMLGPMKGVPPELKELVKGTQRDFKSAVRKLDADVLIYSLATDKDKLSQVIDFCDEEGIDCRIVPEWTDMVTHQARIEAIDGIPILTIRDIPLKNGYNRFVKRAFDLISSALVLLMLSPVMILIALIIKLTDRGPIFFAQDRVGLDRKLIPVYKFRSMRVQKQAESDSRWGVKNDDRITGIGKFIRKTSLDELPQLWNVLKGDMSVVGPRPERPHFVAQFKSRYDQYMRRHAVKAGLTGWAQIQGLRGDTSIEKRVEADIFYIENWTFWFDMLIIIRTIPSMIKNPGE